VTRLLQQLTGCIVVSEPQIINVLLQAPATLVDEETRVRLLRFLIRALGRRRFSDERHYVVKTTSWNVRSLDLFRRAFPEARLVWLQRNPADVLASLLRHDPGWHLLQAELTESLFEIRSDESTALDRTMFYTRALAALLTAARDARGTMVTVDYSELPAAAWTIVAPLFGLAPATEETARMEMQARYYSKEAAPRPFESAAEQVAFPESIRTKAVTQLEALYRELNDRRASRQDLLRSGASR
jgi:hypothetical protein